MTGVTDPGYSYNLKSIMKIKIILPILVVFALSPITHAVSPPPDGGYPGGNTAEGQQALFSVTTGTYNTAVGFLSLRNNTEGQFNTAIGAGALPANTGALNTATGAGALLSNITGNSNTANGAFALFSNNGDPFQGRGVFNSAFGTYALFANTTGWKNCAFGSDSLHHSTGDANSAFGAEALYYNSNGTANTAIGAGALFSNISGSYNTAVGIDAGLGLTTGSYNVYIGWEIPGQTNEVGHTYISNIKSTVQPPVNGSEYVTVRLADGLLGHTSSSKRYKEDVKPMDTASEMLYRLKPVTYRYNKDIDPSQSLDYGLVAEDVAKVDPKLAIRDGKGQIESVRYAAISAMLLNEFLKEHKKVEAQQSKIDQQQATISELKITVARQRKDFDAVVTEQQRRFQATLAKQEDQIRALASGLQKVTAQIEASRPAPQIVLGHP